MQYRRQGGEGGGGGAATEVVAVAPTVTSVDVAPSSVSTGANVAEVGSINSSGDALADWPDQSSVTRTYSMTKSFVAV